MSVKAGTRRTLLQWGIKHLFRIFRQRQLDASSRVYQADKMYQLELQTFPKTSSHNSYVYNRSAFMLLAALLSTITIGLLGCPSSQAFEQPANRASRLSDIRPSGFRRGRGITTTACVHHASGSGVLAPCWLCGRSPHSHHEVPAQQWLSASARAPWIMLYTTGMVATASAKLVISRLANEVGEQDKKAGDGSVKVGVEDSIKGAMISFIKAYKKELSPLMPPACRFLPTCSVYGVEAIEKFGPVKGAVLTAWRLMRCNPFGGYGIDYPRWPPPGWFAGEKW